MVRTSARGALVLGLALLGAGCGSAQDASVRDVATAFYAAVSGHDGAKACGLLAPETSDALEQSAGKPCAQAILEEDLPDTAAPGDVSAYGTMAQVKAGTDTAFLARFQDGWRVMAAGCAPAAHGAAAAVGRYDCQVSGG